MCIIVYKPSSHELPTEHTLRNCISSNPHGIGFMFRDNEGYVHIYKGFKRVEELVLALNKADRRFDLFTNELAIHFRYATHGVVSPGNCHPFPITTNVNKLRETIQVTNRALMHNGIISGVDLKAGSTISDTMAFVKKLSENFDIDNGFTISDGKFCIMTEDKTYLIGFFEEENGIFYSNGGYKWGGTIYRVGSFHNDDVETWLPFVGEDIDEDIADNLTPDDIKLLKEATTCDTENNDDGRC